MPNETTAESIGKATAQIAKAARKPNTNNMPLETTALYPTGTSSCHAAADVPVGVPAMPCSACAAGFCVKPWVAAAAAALAATSACV